MDCFGWKTLTLKITRKKTFENVVFGLIDMENLDIYSRGRGDLFKCLDVFRYVYLQQSNKDARAYLLQ